MIEFKHVSKTYASKTGPVEALHNINLSVASTEIMGIIGESGAGKSTLIRCANLLERPTEGEIIIDNTSLTAQTPAGLRACRQKIGMIFQHFNLLSQRTVYDNIALPLAFSKTPTSQHHKKITTLLNLVGLENRAEHYPSQLSGGQKQRVAIARALINDPKVLLCDEITSALDPQTTIAILNLLEHIRYHLGVTILLITHDMQVIKHMCDRVAVLENGRIIEKNKVSRFFAKQKTETGHRFVSSSIRQDLPKEITSLLQAEPSSENAPVIRLWFHEKSTSQPIIAGTCQRFKVDINILQANLEYIHHHPVGIMIVKIDGLSENTGAAIVHLKALGIKVESLGYVTSHVI